MPLNPVLKSFWKKKADIKVLKGGRSSSKTFDIAGFAGFLAQKYKVKFLCIRQFQARIQESVYATLVIQIENLGLTDDFDILKTVIRHKTTGSEFHFYGMQRNTAEIKGFTGANVCWIEEAEGLTKEQWSIIEPTIREQGSECWISYNPRLVSDFIETSAAFQHDPENGVIVRHINYQENPFLSETMLRKINRLKNSDYEEYEHVYLGIARSDDERVIIKRSWIEAAIDAHVKLGLEITGDHRIGFDIADGGKDLCSQIHAHGIVATWGEHWKAGEDELLESCSRVYSSALDNSCHITYDSIGVGAGAGAKFNEMNSARISQRLKPTLEHSKYIAGGKVLNPDAYYVYYGSTQESIKNKDFFSNIKAQSWWLIAERFRNTYNAVIKGEQFEYDELISISADIPNLKNLITELSTPRRNFDNAGKVKVESKEDLAKRDIASPNDADAFIMAMQKTTKTYNINAW